MKSMSRRLFIQEALLATAAAAAIQPDFILAADAQKKSGPNDRLSVAVLGVNKRGKNHVKAYASNPNCFISYICDPDAAVGEKVAAGIKSKPKFVQDLRRVLEDKSVDCISIATPNHWHALAAIWAMQAGKDVYVEKPVSHSLAEGRLMVKAARKYNRICQVGTQHRSNGANRAAADYVKSGKLGEVKLLRACVYRQRPSIGPAGNYAPPASVDYNLWAGPSPMEMPVRRKSFHYEWHWFWDYGDGEMANNSVHAVDALRLMTGLQGLGNSVLSYGGVLGMNDCRETPTVQVSVHDFGPITLVEEIRNLKSGKPPRGAWVAVGTEGYISDRAVYDPDGKLVQKFEGPSVDHFDNFLKAVKSRKREDLMADIEEGHISTGITHVTNISQRLGAPASPAEIRAALEKVKGNEDVAQSLEDILSHLKENNVDVDKTPLTLGQLLKIDSGAERFIDNNAANALLTRQYRAPFVVPSENQL